jgi:Holliday junction resolvase RusA-like endonuclease
MPVITLFVPGIPQPAGSKRAFQNKKTGAMIVTDANAKAKPWQADVKDKGVAAMDGLELLEGPLSVTMHFRMVRPKGHLNAKGELRPSAPAYPAVRPDVLKLARAVEDALTGIVWRDDAQIVQEYVYKDYAVDGPPGVAVRVLWW